MTTTSRNSTTCERYEHKGYFICVYRVVSGNTVHFETEIDSKCIDFETGCLVMNSITDTPVNITGNVSKYDAKSQCEYAMCALFTGKVYIDKYL